MNKTEAARKLAELILLRNVGRLYFGCSVDWIEMERALVIAIAELGGVGDWSK